MILLLLFRSNSLLLQSGHLKCLDQAARYERRGATVALILCWWCASLDYEIEVGNEASTSALLLESFDKSGVRVRGYSGAWRCQKSPLFEAGSEC